VNQHSVEATSQPGQPCKYVALFIIVVLSTRLGSTTTMLAEYDVEPRFVYMQSPLSDLTIAKGRIA
jgi:hypothetical protein